MSQKNYYQFVADQDQKLKILPHQSVGTWMMCIQHDIDQTLLQLPCDPQRPFSQTLHAPWRSLRETLEKPNQISETISQILQLRNWVQIPDVLRQLHRMGVKCLFQLSYDPDLHAPEQQIPYLHIEEDSLPLSVSNHKAYIRNLFEAFALHPPRLLMSRFETTLNKARPTKYKLQNAATAFNPIEMGKNSTKDLAWLGFYMDKSSRFSVDSIPFFEHVGHCMETLKLTEWQDYLLFHLLHQVAPWFSDTHHLEDRSQENAFSSHLEVPNEVLTDHSRLGLSRQSWPMDAGAMFIRHHYPVLVEARTHVQHLAESMRAHVLEMFERSSWQPVTKFEAQAKLQQLKFLIGWPEGHGGVEALLAPLPASPVHFWDEWLLAGHTQQYQHASQQGARKTERGAWRFLSPSITNACYSRELNVVFVPPSLFVPPFYFPNNQDENKTPAFYGGMGSILAHEIYHAFDYDSRQISARSMIVDWWDPIDRLHFDQQAKLMVKLFREKRSISGRYKMDGRLTLSENIADGVALEIAWSAFVTDWKAKFFVAPDREASERFFQSFAMTQVQLYTPDALRYALKHDLHALAMARVNLPLSCFPPFLDLFAISAKDAMFTPVEKRPQFLPEKKARD